MDTARSKLVIVMVMKTVFYSYCSKCTKQYRLYNHLLPSEHTHTERRIRARSRLLNISLVLTRAKFDTVPPVLIIWAVTQIGREFNLLIHITYKQNYITKWHRHEFQKRWSLPDWESDGVNASYKFRSFIAPSSP